MYTKNSQYAKMSHFGVSCRYLEHGYLPPIHLRIVDSGVAKPGRLASILFRVFVSNPWLFLMYV
jgi:hypothetical protein